MNVECHFESDAIEAAASGAWTQSLREHVGLCSECAAAVDVAGWMSEFAAVDERQHLLPDPAVLWLKARLLQNRADVNRAALPITQLQIAAYLIIAAGWAALLTWKSAALQAWMTHVSPGHLILGASGVESTSLSVTILVTIIALSSATVALAMHTILAEE